MFTYSLALQLDFRNGLVASAAVAWHLYGHGGKTRTNAHKQSLQGHDDDNQDVETDTHQARSNYHHLSLACLLAHLPASQLASSFASPLVAPLPQHHNGWCNNNNMAQYREPVIWPSGHFNKYMRFPNRAKRVVSSAIHRRLLLLTPTLPLLLLHSRTPSLSLSLARSLAPLSYFANLSLSILLYYWPSLPALSSPLPWLCVECSSDYIYAKSRHLRELMHAEAMQPRHYFFFLSNPSHFNLVPVQQQAVLSLHLFPNLVCVIIIIFRPPSQSRFSHESPVSS